MPALDPIEAALARLMPPALSQNCQHELEEMIDGLAGQEPQAFLAAAPRPTHWIIGSGIAATAAGLLAIHPLIRSTLDRQFSAQAEETLSGLVRVSESDRIQSMTDEGWQENSQGHAMHALRLNVVEENSVMDEETGMIVLISQPREELFLMPISSF